MDKISRAAAWGKPSLRLVIAQALAGSVLALILAIFLAGPHLVARKVLPTLDTSVVVVGSITGVLFLILAVAAFVLSLNRGSFLLAGMLVAPGLVYLVAPMTATSHMVAMADSSGLVHVLSTGLPIVGLGAVKAIETIRMTQTGVALFHNREQPK